MGTIWTEIRAMCFIIAIFVGGAMTGCALADWSWEREARDRGHLVQCLGSSGWHWECE